MIKGIKVISILLSAMLLLSMSMPVFAAGVPSQKEEVIYIMTDAGGTVKSGNVVNIFGNGDIMDYGDYSEVKMLNTSDAIKQNGDMITFSTTADKAYYQGTMKSVEIPWNISIRYFIDGKEYSAKDVEGKSGKLEIRFKVTKNDNCKGNFFNDYAMQTAFTLNMNHCSDITSDAMEVNVGKNKKLTYTVLPGKGIDTVITANVTDFEMESVSINGIKLKLNVEINDKKLMDKISELVGGIIKVDDGANLLKDGTSDLEKGSSSLKDGTSSLKSGVTSLDDGITRLNTGIISVQDGLNTLNSQSATLVNGSAEVKTALQTIGASLDEVAITAEDLEQLTTASGEIKTGITNLNDGVNQLQSNIGYAQYKALMSQNGLDMDALKAGNEQALTGLSEQIVNMQTTLAQIKDKPGYAEYAAQLETQIGLLQNIITLLKGNNGAIEGTESYLNALSEAVGELHSGVTLLNEKYVSFDAAITKLANTLISTLADLAKLSAGINTLITNYTELDNGIGEYTDGVAQLASGYSQIIDGVSALAQGSKDLSSGSGDLYDGAIELYDGVIVLCDGAKELSDGTKEMRDKTSNMDTQLQNQINEILASIRGDDSEAVSFVSKKNTNVDSVQFVIKTDAIEKAKTVTPETETKEELDFWQKLLRLFEL